jgi:hypothetical protein
MSNLTNERFSDSRDSRIRQTIEVATNETVRTLRRELLVGSPLEHEIATTAARLAAQDLLFALVEAGELSANFDADVVGARLVRDPAPTGVQNA